MDAGGRMESVYFLVLWIGAATFHTLFDCKVKPYLEDIRRKTDN